MNEITQLILDIKHLVNFELTQTFDYKATLLGIGIFLIASKESKEIDDPV